MAWEYKREESSNFEEIPEGRYRVLIETAEKAVSKRSGNDMLVLKFAVSQQSGHLWYYIPFLEDRPKITNRMLTQLFDSFGIEEGNFNLASYVGKAGGVNVKHDENGRAKVNYLLSKKQQEDLPPYIGMKIERMPIADADGFMQVQEGDTGLPF